MPVFPPQERFIIYDYETSGKDYWFDKPYQYAAVTTDKHFNQIGDPTVIYCKPLLDCLPHVEAIAVTGINLNEVESKGLIHLDFVEKIHRKMLQASVTTMGFNSIDFDSMITRMGNYLNFIPMYQGEGNKNNGISQFDFYLFFAMLKALRPNQGLKFPDQNLKLESLSKENNLNHNSHDALGDVEALVTLAKRAKESNDDLWNACYLNRMPKDIQVKLNSQKPWIHVSKFYSPGHGKIKFIQSLCMHPRFRKRFIVFDLSSNIDLLFDLSSEEISQRLYTKRDTLLKENLEPIPLSVINSRAAPILLKPKDFFNRSDAERLSIDLEIIRKNNDRLKTLSSSDISYLRDKLCNVYDREYEESYDSDIDQQMYAQFMPDSDINRVRDAKRDGSEGILSLLNNSYLLKDPRSKELLFRLAARNFYSNLDTRQQERWKAFCRQKIIGGKYNGVSGFKENDINLPHNYDSFIKNYNLHMSSPDITDTKKRMLEIAKNYVDKQIAFITS